MRSVTTPASRRLVCPGLLAAVLACLIPVNTVSAMSGFAVNVLNECRLAGRTPPTFDANPCAVCHTGPAGRESAARLTTAGRAYQRGQILTTFCPDSPVIAPDNTAPVLAPLASPLHLTAGALLTLPIAATDAQGDKVILSVKPLPPGARFKRQSSRAGDQWLGQLAWRSKPRHQNKTFLLTVTAREQGPRPALQSSQSIALHVDGGNPANPRMHAIGDRVWLTNERAGHPAHYRQRPADCKSCHGGDLRGASASVAGADRRYRFEDWPVQIRAGDPVGCWTCHNGPEDDDGPGRDDD